MYDSKGYIQRSFAVSWIKMQSPIENDHMLLFPDDDYYFEGLGIVTGPDNVNNENIEEDNIVEDMEECLIQQQQEEKDADNPMHKRKRSPTPELSQGNLIRKRNVSFDNNSSEEEENETKQNVMEQASDNMSLENANGKALSTEGIHLPISSKGTSVHILPEDPSEEKLEDMIHLIERRRKYSKHFMVDSEQLIYRLTKTSQLTLSEHIKKSLQAVFNKLTENITPNDHVGFSFSIGGRDGWVPFKPATELKKDDIWEVLDTIFQSNAEAQLTNTFDITRTVVNLPVGSRRRLKANTITEELIQKRGIIYIKNDQDHLCLPRSIALGIAKHTSKKEYKKQLNSIKYNKQKATALVEAAGVTVQETGCSIDEIRKFQTHLKEYCIVVYRAETRGRVVLFQGHNVSNNKKHIHILHSDNNHYDLIVSLTAAFSCSYYCSHCNTPYNNKDSHRCEAMCYNCRKAPPCTFENNVHCNDCSRNFKSDTCFQNHKNKESFINGKKQVCLSQCEKVGYCQKCFKIYFKNKVHVCYQTYCNSCNSMKDPEHLCYMSIDKKVPILSKTLFVFYDLETQQERVLENGDILHEPNLCVYESRCSNCITHEGNYQCHSCNRNPIIYESDVIKCFVNDILSFRRKFTRVIVIAHNGQSFDHQFVLNYILLNKQKIEPKLIMRGTKILLLQLGNVKFIDSFNFIPIALRHIPKALGLPDNLKKGYFPYLFNKKSNNEYIGKIPDMNYFDPDSMLKNEKMKFIEWYTEQERKNELYNFKKEMIEYCKADVSILAESCVRFRSMFLDECNVCPLTESVTIASACNLVFRRKYLEPNKIALLPKSGYRMLDKQSSTAALWLILMEKEKNIVIQQSSRGRETKILGMKVDGFCNETNEIFEFYGCFWHGHPVCYKSNRNKPIGLRNNYDTLESRYESTLLKSDLIRQNGYTLIEKWECEFLNELKNDPYLINDKNHPLLKKIPLSPRDAFYGGRTENTKMYKKCNNNEQIHYYDVISLYPYIVKYGKFPVGHPTVYIGHEECTTLNIQEIDGLIKCTVIPPQNLYLPILPCKLHNKLMFYLCHTCAKNFQQECNHTDSERQFTGTWVIDEVRKTLEKGYKIREIHEIWKYKVEKYDSKNKTGVFFSHMMNKFIKSKLEASGWPRENMTHSEKEEYIMKVLENEGVQLEPDKIEKNPGLRSLAKLMLNSFWGKLGQRENQSKAEIVHDPGQLYELVSNPSKNVNSISIINETTVIVNWEHNDDSFVPLSTVNVCIAAYVTCQARLKLYDYLELLQDRVIYYDTDSVIFSAKEGDVKPKLGDFIGDLSDELVVYGNGSYIDEIVVAGPKNYTYSVDSNGIKNFVCKVKGITLSTKTSAVINFNSIKNMVLSEQTESVNIDSNAFRRTNTHQVVTHKETKQYRALSLKRVYKDNYDSVPYGYIP